MSIEGQHVQVYDWTYDTGCYVAGWHGQYAPDLLADFVETAFGYFDHTDHWMDDPRHLREVADLLDEMGHGDAAVDVFALRDGAVERIEEFLQDGTDGGYAWGWLNGEFHLASDEDWENAS